ncbi:haloacid dehalogenase-like hydrolase [Leucobacter chironomi]|uniref:haloacid dehalogenase-like hydrolase n=1 Tax=Leucobacter chironomi TaxID=491918 RepID=UPI00040D58E7|nr:haloacid dehalogenase-like hydrolase [Leucobacter chironomi]
MHTDAGTPADLYVYDLDGVITTRDTFVELLLARLRASRLRYARSLPLIAAWAASRTTSSRSALAQRITTVALRGLSEEAYAQLAREFGARVGADPSWIRESTVRRIRRQVETGARVVIATATEQRLAETLLQAAGVPYHLLCASLIEATPSGVRFMDHRMGQRKADALTELGVPMDTAEFATDSAADLPTALLAKRLVLIGASARTRARFTEQGVSFELGPEG